MIFYIGTQHHLLEVQQHFWVHGDFGKHIILHLDQLL
jgi:hypothetical protein